MPSHVAAAATVVTVLVCLYEPIKPSMSEDVGAPHKPHIK